MYICDAFSVQKRINTAGLGLLSLERPVCEAGLWLAAENVTPGAFPTLKGGLAVPRLFLRAAWLVLNMYVLPFGECCTCYAERTGLTGPSTRRRWVSNGPPGAEALHTGCCASLLESVLCVMPCVRVRGEPLEACAWIPPDPGPLPYDPAMHPSPVAALDLSYEYRPAPSSTSPLSKRPPGAALGIPNTSFNSRALSVKQQRLSLLRPCSPQRTQRRGLRFTGTY